MLPERPQYMSFMLRLWRRPGAEAGWVASLEDAGTGERLAFADVESLFAFLAAHTDPYTRQHEASDSGEKRP
jgi:hypothetical protein